MTTKPAASARVALFQSVSEELVVEGAPPPPPEPIPVAEAVEEDRYPPIELLSRIGALVASTALPAMVTGTLTFRD
jgi:hypothetical protein